VDPGVRPAHWGYDAEEGPERWAALSPAYRLCGEGRAQSPIDIAGAERIDASRIVLDYAAATLRIAHHGHVVDLIDNGHTIQISYDEGSTLVEGDRSFELVQYHFHGPSEHTLEGRAYPMEMHLVHQSSQGELAVLGVLIAEGRHNRAFDPIWENLPHEPGETRHLEEVDVDIDELLPHAASYYRYDGSLTTPPCSEGVRWFVMKDPIELSREQVEAFTSIIHDNSRPTQPLNGRRVAIVE
jgi:carbonic anhydrase